MTKELIRVLFLDIDGVLNSTEFFKTNEDPWKPGADLRDPKFWAKQFDPAAIVRLNRVTQPNNIKIVVSSAWNRMHKYPELIAILRAAGVEAPIIGITPRVERQLGQHTYRGHEIQAWLDWAKDHYEVDTFAIVDDTQDMDHLDDKLVLTDCDTGLLDSHAEELAAILSDGKEFACTCTRYTQDKRRCGRDLCKGQCGCLSCEQSYLDAMSEDRS